MLSSSTVPFANRTAWADASCICSFLAWWEAAWAMTTLPFALPCAELRMFHFIPLSCVWWQPALLQCPPYCSSCSLRPIFMPVQSSTTVFLLPSSSFSPPLCFSFFHYHCHLFFLLTWTKTLKSQLLLRFVRVKSLKCLRLNQKWEDVPFTRNFDFFFEV